MRVFPLLRLLLICLMLLSVGCNHAKKQDPLEILPVDKMYEEAKSALANGNLARAERYYQRLIARFPFGPYTEQAQLELAYTQYKGNKPDDAYSSVNRFIKTYPTHKHIDYAYYLRGLINFNRETGLLARYARQDMTKRDVGNARQAFDDFSDVLKRYPNSPYAPDAHQRMVSLRNMLAQSQVHVAMYYLRRGAYVAAANRSKQIVENYPRTPQVGDALAIMTISYSKLGEAKLAEDSERVLKLNYPNHPFFGGHWPPKRSWWKQVVPFTNKE